MKDFEIKNDTLVRYESACTCEGGIDYMVATPVITKEEFLACYRAWILENEDP